MDKGHVVPHLEARELPMRLPESLLVVGGGVRLMGCGSEVTAIYTGSSVSNRLYKQFILSVKGRRSSAGGTSGRDFPSCSSSIKGAAL